MQSHKINGCVKIQFKVGSIKMSRVFVLIADMNRNVILGRDWQKEQGVRLYVDLGLLLVGNSYVKLEEYIHVSCHVRWSK